MYSKRNKILSLALVLIISLLSLAGCKNPENPETNTDPSSVVMGDILTIDYLDLGLYDFNDLSDYLESTVKKDKFSFNSSEGEYIKLFTDNTLSKEITDYKTVLDSKMVVKKYDSLGNILATFTFPEDKSESNVQGEEASATSSVDENQKILVKIWGNDEDRTLKEAVDTYNKTSPVYQVEFISTPKGNVIGKLKQAKAKGEAPDIIYLDSADMKLLGKEGVIYDISNVGAYQNQQHFTNVAFDAFTDGISCYGLPFDAETTCLAYNLDVFNFAGITDPPKTYDQLAEYAKKITETYSNKNAPIGLFDASDRQAVADTFISWLYRCGGSLLSTDGKRAEFDNAMGERALSLIADLYKNGYSSKDWTQGEFYSGKTTFFEVSSNQYNGTFGSGAKANFGATLHPSITNGKNPTTFKVKGFGVVNNNDIVKAQAAYDFISYYCADKSYQTNYCTRNSKIPTHNKAQRDNAFAGDNMKVFVDTMENAEYLPSFGGRDIIKEYIADAVLSVINENVSVSEALAKAATKTEARLKRN